jgi:hypothetical protein
VYLSTVSGELYALDVATGTFRDLGYFIDPADKANKGSVNYLYGISLNAAENTVVGVPLLKVGGKNVTRVTTYSIAGKKFTKQIDATVDVFTGSNHRDRSGNYYLSSFNWNLTSCRLAILKPPS